jgi:RNA polymerase sigma-70 factor (ECF subfamily)
MMTFNEIYKKYQRSLFNCIRKIVINELDAEELANEAMIRVHKSLSTYNADKGALSTWIHNIGKNAAIDFIRKKKLNTVALENTYVNWMNGEEEAQIDHIIELKDSDNNPEEMMICEEVRETLNAQFATLSKGDQLIASMHYFDGLSYEEVAQEMGMPLGTVKAKIHKARVALMEAFPTEMRRLSTIER